MGNIDKYCSGGAPELHGQVAWLCRLPLAWVLLRKEGVQGMREEEMPGGEGISSWKRWLNAEIWFLLAVLPRVTRFHQDKPGPWSGEFFCKEHKLETREETDCCVARAGFNNMQ